MSAPRYSVGATLTTGSMSQLISRATVTQPIYRGSKRKPREIGKKVTPTQLQLLLRRRENFLRKLRDFTQTLRVKRDKARRRTHAAMHVRGFGHAGSAPCRARTPRAAAALSKLLQYGRTVVPTLPLLRDSVTKDTRYVHAIPYFSRSYTCTSWYA